MKVETKKVKLSDIKLNPDNPRRISEKGMARLVKSLQDFPEMMELREIIVDETMTVLGGNMRTLALRKVGEKEIIAKIVTGMTPDQKREFIIKDNSDFGEWDMDELANMWSDLPLIDWGIGEPEVSVGNEEFLEQKEKELKPYKKVHILISIDIEKADEATELIDKLRSIQGVEIEQSAN